MEHRNRIMYIGYEIVVYINHEAEVFVHIELDGVPLNRKVGNIRQAECYIEDLIFERDGFLFQDSRFRISEEEFSEFENTLEIKELAIHHDKGKRMEFLANEREQRAISEFLNQDIEDSCYDYFWVYCRSRL